MIKLKETKDATCESCRFSPAIRITATCGTESGSSSRSMHLCLPCLVKLANQTVQLQAIALSRVTPAVLGLQQKEGQ